jgi:hypothetical protein
MAEISGLFVTKKTHKKYLVLIYSILKLNSICVSFLSMPHIVKLGLLFSFLPGWFRYTDGTFMI